MTKLASKLPREHGLTGRKLVTEPTTIHAVIALIDVSKLTTDTDTNEVEPTIRVLRAETITQADLPDAATMFRAAVAKRTGGTVLDGFENEMGEDFKAAFGIGAV